MHASHCLIEPKTSPCARESVAPSTMRAGIIARIEPGLGVLMPHASSARLADLRRLAQRYNALAAARLAGRSPGTLRLRRV